ncbi:hypothetical protein ABW19_dt0206356 [Dactylella cylindrospora]|nr:hypothetical protein ABW19_dt0206356 [Dactylella cylindrospora]
MPEMDVPHTPDKARPLAASAGHRQHQAHQISHSQSAGPPNTHQSESRTVPLARRTLAAGLNRPTKSPLPNATSDSKKENIVEISGPLVKAKDEMIKSLVQGVMKVSLEDQEIPVDPKEYTIPLDGDYRELARTLMVQMLQKGIGALLDGQMMRTNEMLNKLMLYSWDKAVECAFLNLLRTNPFISQDSKTRRLDKLFRGFRSTWLQICGKAQRSIDFAEAVCSILFRTQSSLAKSSLELLEFQAQTFALVSHGFYLLHYRLDRLAQGHPLGFHCEHTLMERRKVPRILVDYILLLMNNENFSRVDSGQLPVEILDCAAACIRVLSLDFGDTDVNNHNRVLIDHFARNIVLAGRNRLNILVTAAERTLNLNDFFELDWKGYAAITAHVVKSPSMSIWNPQYGDNGIMFRMQFVNVMREKGKLGDSACLGLRSYLLKLDPNNVLSKCHEIQPRESLKKPKDPDQLSRIVGEHPNVLIRLLILYTWCRSPDRAISVRRIRDSVRGEEKIVNLLWWVFIKNAYQRVKPQQIALETVAFEKYYTWLMPVLKENWDAENKKCIDLLMAWFILGIETHGTIIPRTEKQRHATHMRIMSQRLDCDAAIALLHYHDRDDRIPTYIPFKHHVIISAFSLLFSISKNANKQHNEKVLEAVVKTFAETFLRPDFYETDEVSPPKGYYAVGDIIMEMLKSCPDDTLADTLLTCRDHLHFMHTRDTFMAVLETCKTASLLLLRIPADAEKQPAALQTFNESLDSMTRVMEFLLLCIPNDAYLRKRLRAFSIIAPLCGLINIFTAKPEVSNHTRGTPRPLAKFMSIPKLGRRSLGEFLKTSSKFLDGLFKKWEYDDFLDADMKKQKEGVLDMSLEADVVADMVLRMWKASCGGRY